MFTDSVSVVAAQIEAECVAGAARPWSSFQPLNCVESFKFSQLAQLAALESFNVDDEDEYEYKEKHTERGSKYEDGRQDRLALEEQEKQERQDRVFAYSLQGENNQPIDYRTDDSLRMEAAMDTFLKFCDRLGDPSCPDIP